MRFIHVSDVHLGNIPDSDKPWGKDRAYDIKDTFENVINKCKKESIDLLLISGDLFHRQPLTSDLNEVNDLFSSIPNTKIAIIAGNKDYIRPNSSILNFKFAKNVHYFLSDLPEEYYIEDQNIVIHGFSYTSPECLTPTANSIEIKNDDMTHILLAHGGDASHLPIDFNLLASKNFTYVALGHVHKHEELLDGHIVYAGSLEPQGPTEVKEHGIYIGEINPMTKRLENLRFEPMAKCSYIPLSVTIKESIGEDAIITSIRNEIQKRGANNIYKLTIGGYRDPDLELNFDILNKNFRIIEAIDESEPKYNFISLSKEHPSDMIGTYIRNFQDKGLEDMSYIEKKALFYGINALLKTKDK